MASGRADLVREKLIITKDQLFAEIVAKAKDLFRLDEAGGLHINRGVDDKGTKFKVELFLLARYLSKEGGLVQSAGASADEIARFFGLTPQEVQKRAHDLKQVGKIEADGAGVYHLTEGRIREVLEDLGAKE